MGTSSSMPSRSIRFCMRSPPKMRIRSSCKREVEAASCRIALAAWRVRELICRCGADSCARCPARARPPAGDHLNRVPRPVFRRRKRAKTWSHSVRRADPAGLSEQIGILFSFGQIFLGEEFRIAAEQDVGARGPAMFRRNGDGGLAAGLRDDEGFRARDSLRQHFVPDAHLLQRAASLSDFFNQMVPTKTGWPFSWQRLDLLWPRSGILSSPVPIGPMS